MLSSANRSCYDRDGLASSLKVSVVRGLKTPINFWLKRRRQRHHNPKECTLLHNPGGKTRPIHSDNPDCHFLSSILNNLLIEWILDFITLYFSSCPSLSLPIMRPCLCLVKLFYRLRTSGKLLRKYNSKDETHELDKAPVGHQVYHSPRIFN